jgi:hypothetical protein
MAVLMTVLIILFVVDNMREIFKCNQNLSIKYMLPIFMFIAITIGGLNLPSMNNCSCVVLILYHMVIDNLDLKMLLHSMAGRPYSVFNIELFVLLIP